MQNSLVPTQVEGHPDCPYAGPPAQSPPNAKHGEKQKANYCGDEHTKGKIDDDIVFLEVLAHWAAVVVREVGHWGSLGI